MLAQFAASNGASEVSVGLLPICIAVAALLLGAWLLSSSQVKPGAGCRIGGAAQTSKGQERANEETQRGGSLLAPDAAQAELRPTAEKAGALKPSSAGAAPADPQTLAGPSQTLQPAEGLAVEKPLQARLQYRLGRHDALPPLLCPAPAEIWEVCSTEDATSLLNGCPFDTVVCCSFTRPYAESPGAQERAMKELAAAQPAGFVFARVDLTASPEVANWAGVSTPLVRFLLPDGNVVDEIRPPHTGNGGLQKTVLGLAAKTAKLAPPKLEKLGQKFPGSLHDEAHVMAPKGDTEKMRQRGSELLKELQATAVEEESFQALCQLCSLPRGGHSARVRHVASLAQIIRKAPAAGAVPLLDLARRLAYGKALGGSDPGALEALELLLDAVLGSAFDAARFDATRASLALQCLAGCFGQASLHEALLPIVGQVVCAEAWPMLWDGKVAASRQPQGSERTPAAAESAAAALLLNASVALRAARWRAEQAGLLVAAIDALRRNPANEQVSLAVGNLLAVGGSQEDGKRTLQAQPCPALRALAAAVFHGDLDGPDGAAFPAAWLPEPAATTPGGGQGGDADGGDLAARRRPPNAAIPARHRRMRRGGG